MGESGRMIQTWQVKSHFMRFSSFLVALAIFASAATVSFAQTSISAPAGWKTQTREGGARTFTPSDLQSGEVYKITVYDSAPMKEKTLEEFLRAFAGKVGKGPGQLAAPLKVTSSRGQTATGIGTYNGPNKTQLLAVFVGLTFDGGGNIHVMRTLLSGPNTLLERYKAHSNALMESLAKRAVAEAGRNFHRTPSEVLQKLKTVGGPLVPGVYAGNQYHDQELRLRLRVYLYSTGEYRICNENDEDLGSYGKTGNIDYNRNSGRLDLDWTAGVGFHSDDQFCYFGRDANGKPTIYGEDFGGHETRTVLTWVEKPLKRLSKTQEDEQKAEIEAEKNRFKWVKAPGKGVQNAQIAHVLLDSQFNSGSAEETVYLLLKDGSVYADLPVAPDELDIIRSRQKEPDKWGKWRKTAAGFKVSWANSPLQDLPGSPVAASPAQQKLNGRWGTGSFSGVVGMSASSSQWGVTFGKNGRFRKDSRSLHTSSFGFGDQATHFSSGHNDDESFAGGFGANFAISSSQKKKNPNGNREGDYSLNGWVLTLRYDNGKIARLPFFFGSKTQSTLYFEGSTMSKDDGK